MSYYKNDLIYILSAGNKYLSVDRSNLLLRELPLLPGSESNPGLCFQGDERSGLYLSSEGVVSVASLGWLTCSFSDNELALYNRSRDKIKLKIAHSGEKTLYFPGDSGTLSLVEDNQVNKINNEVTDIIYPGMVVKVDTATGVKKALGDTEVNFGYGIAAVEAAITENVTVTHSGVVSLDDWTNALGSTTLTVGARYYADTTTPGMISTSGTQLIGIALTTTNLLLRIG